MLHRSHYSRDWQVHLQQEGCFPRSIVTNKKHGIPSFDPPLQDEGCEVDRNSLTSFAMQDGHVIE